MTVFSVTIDDPASLTGITWAREEHNKTLPPPPEAGTDGEGNPLPAPENPNPPIATDEEYVQWVMEQAAISYSDQKLRSEYQAHYENAISEASAVRAERAKSQEKVG